MTFYEKIIDYSRNVFHHNRSKFNRNTFILTPEDLAHEVIAEGITDISEIKKKIFKTFIYEVSRHRRNRGLTQYVEKFTSDKVCTICHELKPINAFKLVKNRGYIEGYCIDCRKKRESEYHKVNYSNKIFVEEKNKRRRGLFQKNPIYKIRNRQRQKRFWNKERDELTDKWIIRCLKRHKKEQPTPEVIEQHRQSILKRRNKLLNKQP